MVKDKVYIPWLDWAKVIGIYMMIIGHMNCVDERCGQWIYSFHMPLFFVLSGITFHPRPFKDSLVRVFKTLIVPFLIMSTLWCLYYLACYIHGGRPLKDIIPYVIGTFISPGKNFLIFHPLCIYLWFLLALAMIKTVSSLLKGKRLLLTVSLCSFICAVILSNNGVVLPFALDSAMLAFPFFVGGYLMSGYFHHNVKKPYLILAAVISLLAVSLISQFNGRVDINHNLYGNNALLFLLCGIIGTLMVVSFSSLISNKLLGGGIKILSYGTLLMVGFSAMLTSVYKDLISLVLPTVYIENNLFGMLLGLIVLITFYPVTLLCKKYFPAIIGFCK